MAFVLAIRDLHRDATSKNSRLLLRNKCEIIDLLSVKLINTILEPNPTPESVFSEKWAFVFSDCFQAYLWLPYIAIHTSS